MSIQQINGESPVILPAKEQRSKMDNKMKEAQKDRIDLSEEAKALYGSDQSGRIQEIREKIRNGYYLRHDVTEDIVDGIISDLVQSPK